MLIENAILITYNKTFENWCMNICISDLGSVIHEIKEYTELWLSI